ncbi:hypothetical protein ACROYT_G025540 [Oculina patagonica]
MVGEQGSRTSGTGGNGPTSVPQSYRWKRIQNMNVRSRLQEVSGSLNCAEKFSSLVSCHRGYGSVAFYAVFSLFILTFLYTIWKIVSAHSRSARRPGSGNSTSPTMLSPTAHAPTGYASAHAWIKTENVLDHFHQSVKKLRPFQNDAPQRKPSPAIYSPLGNEQRDKISSVTNNVDFPTRGNVVLENPSPTWPSSERATKRFYNYYPDAFNTVQPPVNYPSFPRVPNSLGIFNENATPLSSPLANVSYRAPYYFPTNKNTLPQSSYDNSYYGDNSIQYTGDSAQTSPSPLISFFTESSHDADKSRHLLKQSRRNRKKSRRKITRHHKKKRKHSREHLEYEYIENIAEKSDRNAKKVRSARHHKVHSNKKALKHLRKKYHEEKVSKHHYGTTRGNKHLAPHAPKYKGTHISTKAHAQHHVRKHLKVHNKKPRYILRKYRRTNIPHPQKPTQASYSKSSDKKTPIKNFHRLRHLLVHRTSHGNHHKIFNFKLYRRYRKHHTVDDEIRGKWKVSRHHVRTCKLLQQFSTRGTVKITRTSGHNRRFLHTLLICRPVRLKVRRGHQRGRFSLKYAQLCSKKWYVTNGVIHVHKTSLNDQDEIPRYNVRICEPSYAHAEKLVPAEGKETRVWSISEQFVRRMEKEDAKKFRVKSNSLKRGHKHNHKKKKSSHDKKKKKESARERGGSYKSNKSRKKLSRDHHLRKTATHRIIRHHKFKNSQHIKHHFKNSKSQTFHDNKKKKHERKEKLTLGNSKKDSARKAKGGIMDSDKLFYGKLLKVLKLAKMYDRKKANASKNSDVFDSLEAVLAQNQNVTKISSHSKSNIKMELNGKKNRTTKHQVSQKHSPKHTQKIQEKSNDTIQKLLAKILPAVVGMIKGDAHHGISAITMVTTKPTKSTTTQKMTTSKITPTSPITPLKTKSSDGNIENIMRSILPLLLKKAGIAQKHPSPGLKSSPMVKKPQSLPKKRVPQPKRTANKSGLTSILASLGLGNLASNSLSSTISAKETAVTNKPVIKPTQRSTLARRITTLLPKIPAQPPITRPTPTPSVTTIQTPPLLLQADTPRGQPMSSPDISQMTSPGIPPVPLSAPSSVQLPAVPQQGASPISTPISTLQSAVSPQAFNSDPYSRNILCFGDSLTSGYFNHGRSFHPYSQRLSQLLNADGRLKYYVKTSGKVREMAHGSMARRLPQVLGNSSRFDWVIILGGTNDVAHVKNFGDDDSFMNQLINVWKPRIVRDIEVLHEIAHKYGARTVLLTIPESAYEAWPNYKTLWVMRKKLNEDLRDYARRSQGNVVLCDLATQLPRHSLSPQAQAILWNDHLHLTPYGYDKMAEIVYKCLKPSLSK